MPMPMYAFFVIVALNRYHAADMTITPGVTTGVATPVTKFRFIPNPQTGYYTPLRIGYRPSGVYVCGICGQTYSGISHRMTFVLANGLETQSCIEELYDLVAARRRECPALPDEEQK